MTKISVIIPVYNEAKGIGVVLKDIRAALRGKKDYEIIVVDDASTDDTAKAIKQADAKVRLIQHELNRGVGAARKSGLRAAKGEQIVMIDGDSSYPAEEIPKLLSFLPGYDMAVGTRQREAGTLKLLRSTAKFLIRKLAEFAIGQRIPDLNSGLRVFKKSVAIRFMGILPEGHSWVSTQTLCFLANNYRIHYHPISYKKRIGASTFHPWKDTKTYLTLVLTTVMFFNPLRFFIPTALILAALAGYRIYHDITLLHRIRESNISISLTVVLILMMGLLADLIVRSSRGKYQD